MIVFFTQFFYPFIYGGGEYLFFSLAKELVTRGNKVHVISQRINGCKTTEVIDGIVVHRVGNEVSYGGILPSSLLSNLTYIFFSVLEGLDLLSTEENMGGRTIIHSNTYAPALSGKICSSIFRVPFVISFHDVYLATSKSFWVNWMENSGSRVPHLSAFLAKQIEKLILKTRPSVFHTVSLASKEDLIQCGVHPRRISVIENGLIEEDYQAGEDSMEKRDSPRHTALFIGRLVFYKNLQTVLVAFRSVVQSVPDARLIVVGDGPYRGTLEGLVADMKDKVSFRGYVSHSEKLDFIRQSSFTVFPSVVEGFGIAIIESFVCGKPVIVSNVRPMSDIVNDGFNGYVLPPFSVKAWIEKMKELFETEGLAEKLGSHAHETFSSRYRMTEVAGRMESLYGEIVGAARSSNGLFYQEFKRNGNYVGPSISNNDSHSW